MRQKQTLRRNLIIWFLAFVSIYLLLSLSALSPASASQPTSSSTPTSTPTPRPIMLTDRVADPKQPGIHYFSATGHTLRGAFLDYWNRYGGLAQFGYPLTEEFYEEVGSGHEQYLVQYFERNRLEHHPENRGTQYEVLLGALGRDFRSQDPPSAAQPGALYFRETGHNLSGAFRRYWEAHGGLFVHGYPITEAKMERSTNGKEYLVQWFERSRFEHHPENRPPYDVLLGLLGRQLSEKKGYPYGWYPEYGHAADFSWIAGRMMVFGGSVIGPTCEDPYCTCAVFRYIQRPLTTMQVITVYQHLPYEVTDKIGASEPYVFFGRRAEPGERHAECIIRPSPGYFAEAVQANPALRLWTPGSKP